MKRQRGFASDNNSGVHPLILESIVNANTGHEVGYGDDKYTEKAIKNFKNLFGNDIEVFFVLTGTGANVLGINNMGHSFNSIICPATAHINIDECGAPEKFTGMKTISIPTDNGKITVKDIRPHMHGIGFEHHSQPGIISITQPTELGTLYTPDEIKNLADFAHSNHMYLQMDGARISNAVASLDMPIADFTKNCGVDVLSFGGTKNGMMYGEAVVFLNKEISQNFKYFRKQGMQLASKMRYIGAQFNAFFEDDLWLKNAAHSNKMAKLLHDAVKDIDEVTITQAVQANGVFAIIPNEVIEKLQNEYFFYTWDEGRSEVRWMCSFDTTQDDIIEFAQLLKKLIKEKK
ncbi:MAG: low specificity L-threonine aldolase [Salinivirgaceae bacterium]|nr:low specificity L-threonine aldolase [Salinivirgaceae bacterium]